MYATLVSRFSLIRINVIKALGCTGVKSSVKPYYNIYVIDCLSFSCLASLSFFILDIAKI